MALDPERRPTKLPPCTPPANPSKDPAAFIPDFAPGLGAACRWRVLIGSIGSVGMWSVVVVLPVVQGEFGATRGAVSLAFTMTMLGFGLGGVVTGKITDRFGIVHGDRAQHRRCWRSAISAPDCRPRCGSSSWCIS